MTGRIAVLPQVGHGVRLVVRGAGAVLGEIGWWLAGAWRLDRVGSASDGRLADGWRVRGVGGDSGHC